MRSAVAFWRAGGTRGPKRCGGSPSKCGAAVAPQRRKRSGKLDDETAEAMSQIAELERADKEARLVRALVNCALRRIAFGMKQPRNFRAVDWGDMAVLLRSPANKAESYAKEFLRLMCRWWWRAVPSIKRWKSQICSAC